MTILNLALIGMVVNGTPMSDPPAVRRLGLWSSLMGHDKDIALAELEKQQELDKMEMANNMVNEAGDRFESVLSDQREYQEEMITKLTAYGDNSLKEFRDNLMQMDQEWLEKEIADIDAKLEYDVQAAVNDTKIKFEQMKTDSEIKTILMNNQALIAQTKTEMMKKYNILAARFTAEMLEQRDELAEKARADLLANAELTDQQMDDIQHQFMRMSAEEVETYQNSMTLIVTKYMEKKNELTDYKQKALAAYAIANEDKKKAAMQYYLKNKAHIESQWIEYNNEQMEWLSHYEHILKQQRDHEEELEKEIMEMQMGYLGDLSEGLNEMEMRQDAASQKVVDTAVDYSNARSDSFNEYQLKKMELKQEQELAMAQLEADKAQAQTKTISPEGTISALATANNVVKAIAPTVGPAVVASTTSGAMDRLAKGMGCMVIILGLL